MKFNFQDNYIMIKYGYQMGIFVKYIKIYGTGPDIFIKGYSDILDFAEIGFPFIVN